ncbi:MAG: Rieske (2Fe-2S) protein [Gammaproteobacteria bacterium]|nr:MAG: Rieske (2Fe-2S) protein [Gammaproteobacteria bacterium]
MSKTNHIELCHVDELEEGSARGFPDVNGNSDHGIFLVKKDGQVYGYINHCPHTGAPLEWMPDQFLSLDGNFIQCSFHGARFEIDTGLCIHGPCVNKTIHSLNLETRDGKIYWVHEEDISTDQSID